IRAMPRPAALRSTCGRRSDSAGLGIADPSLAAANLDGALEAKGEARARRQLDLVAACRDDGPGAADQRTHHRALAAVDERAEHTADQRSKAGLALVERVLLHAHDARLEARPATVAEL